MCPAHYLSRGVIGALLPRNGGLSGPDKGYPVLVAFLAQTKVIPYWWLVWPRQRLSRIGGLSGPDKGYPVLVACLAQTKVIPYCCIGGFSEGLSGADNVHFVNFKFCSIYPWYNGFMGKFCDFIIFQKVFFFLILYEPHINFIFQFGFKQIGRIFQPENLKKYVFSNPEIHIFVKSYVSNALIQKF